MKILICNLALRPNPETFPPVACTALCNVLSKAGFDPVFYDIDAKRPSLSELAEYFKKEKYNIVGISAVVSTGYKYTKNLSFLIKKYSPDTKIILGGNLAAAHNVILTKCQIDICVVGEGEKVLVNLAKHYKEYGNFCSTNTKLRTIKGIVFKNELGESVFTGHETPILPHEIAQPDYDLLAKYSVISNYIFDPFTRIDFACDERSYAKHRQGKMMATIFTSKGCINKCTFCHRWIKGYRIIPVANVIATIIHLVDKYNVGFFCISDECFGESIVWLEEFIKQIKPLDVLFQVGGARVSIIKDDPTIISRLKEAGLTALYFGMESGSDRILKIMEKNASGTDNLYAARLCADAGVFTIIQLVVGMPGENEQTISETSAFVNAATEILPYPFPVSINYLQSLPGTPTYDFLRNHGLLGKTIDEEERYLLAVSDTNASDFKHYKNVTEAQLSVVKTWTTKILYSSFVNWFKKHDWKFNGFNITGAKDNKVASHTIASSMLMFTPKKIMFYRSIDLSGDIFWKILIFKSKCGLYGFFRALALLVGIIKEGNDRSQYIIDSDSLKTIVEKQCNKIQNL